MMLILWLILAFILVVMVVILLSRITLIIDTESHNYRMDISAIGNLQLVPSWESEDLIHLRVKLWFWKQMDWSLSKLLLNPRKKVGPKKKHNRSRYKISRSKFRKLLRSFQIQRFYLNLDTGNPLWNSYLLLLFYFIENGHEKMEINFVGQNQLKLKLSNRPIHILAALLI